MGNLEFYKTHLINLSTWDDFLLKESGLPGPRGNIELGQAVAELGNRALFDRYLTYKPDVAPTNSPYEFLAFCGVLGLGHLLAEGDYSLLNILRSLSSDTRWRMREGVAMALQRLGDVNMDLLLNEMASWANGNTHEQRAAAAAICEPRLLNQERHATQSLSILDLITDSMTRNEDRRSEGYQALRKGMGYCWSVATAALPHIGKTLMEKWMSFPDKDIQWIMRENLKKNRLVRIDPEWTERWLKALSTTKTNP